MTNLFWKSTFEGVFSALDAGKSPVLASGLGAASRAHLAAALARQQDAPLFVLCPDEAASETMARDLSALLGKSALYIPPRDMVFFKSEAVTRQSEQKRIAALYALASGMVKIAVCPVSAALCRTISPDALAKCAVTIKATQSISPDDVAAALLRCGYASRAQVDGVGQFSRRGGILDFFSPLHENPVRIEFWGDEIDSMGFFDIESQRRIEPVSECTILPAAEALPALCPGGSAALAAAISKLASGARGRNVKLSETLFADCDLLAAGAALTAPDRYLSLIYPEFSSVLDYIPQDALVFIDQPSKTGKLAAEQEKLLREDLRALTQGGVLAPSLCDFRKSYNDAAQQLLGFPLVMGDNFTTSQCRPAPAAISAITAKQLPGYGGSFDTAAQDVRHYISTGFSVLVLTSDERRANVLRSFFEEREIPSRLINGKEAEIAARTCSIAIGALSGGFEYPAAKLAVLTDAQLMHAGLRKTKKKRADKNRRAIASSAELSEGDLIVHEAHGIGRFAGIVQMKNDGIAKDYIKLCYAGTDILYLPATQLDLVSKYVGGGEDRPVKLSKMGGGDWTRAKTRAKAAAKEMAGELIRLYAERRRMPGHAFAPDSAWQTEFEEAFGYQETDDQLRAIADIKADMEASSPMDRLLCGDVGYGKTEVALRAAMKCVLDGAQVAILVPTTVLAQQHYQTAMQRFFGYPIKIELLSRFRTPTQVKETKNSLADGSVDIVIGTHSLLQKDINFKKLGLLIIDEEQRFGVTHKERLKEMSRGIDSLTLSATPIPRTLNMAMSGLRDMSTLEEPPQDRLPVQTFVLEHDWETLCDAIRRETLRGGQVYYLHNRIENIERVALRISNMLPETSIAVAHGRMSEDELTSAMESVSSGETQVLVCTTIIETGIDIPNVNTLIIEDADSLGLAQLHQIRGRVGRSNRRASAYLTFRRGKVLSEIAEKRLSAIREFAGFNSGFRIAMRDLEIRGAGNLLGAEQSGHMIDVGYDMYLKLLEEAVLEERGEKVLPRAECAADLAVSANIPERYVQSAEQRMDLYRRIAQIRTEAQADDLTDELIDRFGDPPPSVNALVHVALLRGEASGAGITDISQKSGFLRFTLANFELEKVSALYANPKYKGRIKVEAGQKPRLSLKLKNNRIIEAAREFVTDFSELNLPSAPL